MRTKLTMVFVLFFAGLAYAQQTVPSPFQPIKDVFALAGDIDFVTRFIVLLLSLVILGISIMAYQRSKSRRMLFITVAFLLFAAKWALKVVDLFMSPGTFFTDAIENVFEMLILLMLFFAIFKK